MSLKKNDDIPKLEWNEFIKWQNGVKHYEVEIKDEFGLFNKITNISSSTLFFTDSISNHDNLEQICYRIKAISFDSFSNGIPIESYSNIRCVLGNSILLVPNAFTPNLDANNPKFVVFGNYIKSYHITIFNRWGQLVFESDNINNSWDGTYNQNEMADGIYIYQIRAQGFDNKNFNLKGNITLLR